MQSVYELLARADKALAASRLTSPAGDNAMEYLQAVLKLDADNLQARRGDRASGQSLSEACWKRW